MIIIQWNCRGYRSKYGDIISLIREKNPVIFCIQESMMGQIVPCAPRGYSLESYSLTGNPIAGDGVITLIMQGTPYMRITLNTALQAVACRVGTQQPMTM